MTKTRWALRTYPGGAAAATKAYTIKLHADDSTLDSGNTDVDGAVTYSPNLSPGPYYITGTDTTPDPDAVRVTSSKSTGSGGAYSLAELPMVLRAFGNGIIDGYGNELAITDPDSGTNLSYATGAAIIKGIPAVINTAGTHAITTAQDGTNPKACYLVIEMTGVDEAAEGKSVLKDVCGAAAASPSLPSLTQTEATYQYPLATFTLGNSASSNANDVTSLTDVRTFVGTRNPQVIGVGRRIDPAVSQNITSTTGEDATLTSGSASVTLLNGVVYDLVGHAFLLLKAAAGQTISVAPRINGTDGTFIASNVSSDYIGLANSFAVNGITGSGGSVTNSLRVKVSGGTGVILTGYMAVVATPRT